MRVMLDLRPQSLVRAQDMKVDTLRIIAALLFVVFMVLSIYNIVNVGSQMALMQAELAEMSSARAQMNESETKLLESLVAAREIRNEMKRSADFIGEDIPAVELLSALESAVGSTLRITNIELRPGNVSLKGTATTPQDVIEFGNVLGRMKNVIKKVDAPATTVGDVVSYTIHCELFSAEQVALALAERAENGGDDAEVSR